MSSVVTSSVSSSITGPLLVIPFLILLLSLGLAVWCSGKWTNNYNKFKQVFVRKKASVTEGKTLVEEEV